MSAAAPRSVAVVGLGQMGRGIAQNLDRAGLLAAAFDVAPGAFAAAGLSAAVADAPPHALGATADVVLLVVPASPEIAATMDAGLLDTARAQILVDLTTSYPPDTAALAARAAAAGRAYVDCGMSGGATGATAGTLTLMAGGAVAAVDAVRPLLAPVAQRLVHVGPSGAGHALKLVHNMVLHTVFLATCEGVRAAARYGIDPAVTIDVFNAGNARSFVTERRFPDHILSGTFDGRSYVGTLAKDLSMATRFMAAIDAPALYGPLTDALLARAVAHGLAREDFTRLYDVAERLLAEETAVRGERAA